MRDWVPEARSASALPAETRSRTRVSREPDGHRQRNPQRWSQEALQETLKLFVVSDVGRSKLTLLLFHTINTMVAIFLAKVRRAISGRMPLASNAVRELLQRTRFAGGHDGRTHKHILQVMIAVAGSSPRMATCFFARSSCPLTLR